MSINFRVLKEAALKGTIAHLFIFHGSGTKERRRAVLELAGVLNCKGEHRPCWECSVCKKILSGNHPDIEIVRPEKTSIGIEQIFALQKRIYRKVYEARYRICLLEEADKLTLPAANALLKIAEEPPENTIIIFSCGNAEGIIDTLQSRAQPVYFSPPAEEEWAGEREVFRLSGGDPDLARAIQEYGLAYVRGWLEKYFDIIESGDFLKVFGLFPLEKKECQIFLQVLAVTIKQMVLKGQASPQILTEIRHTIEVIRRQVNHRLALEVLVLKHLKLGGTKIG
jgi:DNA polymerase-3 subunit delta'